MKKLSHKFQNSYITKLVILFIFLVFCIMSYWGLILYNQNYQKYHNLPSIENGSLNLESVDFEKEKWIPLNGEWEYYPDMLIESSPIVYPSLDYHLKLPTIGTSFKYSIPTPTTGVASYRLTLENYPSGVGLITYIPNQRITYRIYLNGLLVTTNFNSDSSKKFSSTGIATIKNRIPLPINNTGTLVIEVEGVKLPNVNYTPILCDISYDYEQTTLRSTYASICLGMFLLIISIYIILLITKDKTFHSLPLLIVLLQSLMLLCTRGEIGLIVNILLPTLGSEVYLKITVLFVHLFPLFITLTTFSVLDITIPKLYKLYVYNISLFAFIFELLTLLGWQNSLSVVSDILLVILILSIIPYLFVWISRAIPYSLGISISYVLLCTGIIIDYTSFKGIFLKSTTLILPTCYLGYIAILISIYLVKAINYQALALQNAQNEASLLQMQLKIQEIDASLMLSQINPHFLYNALLAIRELNKTSSQKANEAILQFASYLRSNMRSITSSSPIPFSEELKHIENYVSIEKLRFQDRLQIVYNINVTEFLLPPLTIQPLVENAIKHGVCQRISGGSVILKTYQDKFNIYIEVIDNGVGFDIHKFENYQGDSTGLKNVKTRLALYHNSSLSITSTLGVGTTVLIRITKGEYYNGNNT